MILLVTPSERGAECSAALQQATGEDTRVAETPAYATALLRKNTYLAIVLDQYLLESEPRETDTMLEHTGGAIAVQVNLAISGMDRLVREVRAAVDRGRREEARARRTAAVRLQSELSGVMTALLLSSDLALETPGLPRSAAEKIETVHSLVQRLREQLTNAGVHE